jgi:hypothetical protein
MSADRSAETAAQLRWTKSSYSAGDGGECVEVAGAGSAVHVRDSKISGGPQLTVRHAQWNAFVRTVVQEAHDN